MYKNKFHIVLAILIVLAGLLPSIGSAQAQEPVPYIEVRLPSDAVAINLGPDVVSVILEVYSPDESELKCSGMFTHTGYDEVYLECWEQRLISRSDIVKLYINGETEPLKVHQVINLTLDVFDPDIGRFAGNLIDSVPAWVTYCNPEPPNEGCFDVDIHTGTSSDWEITLGPNAVSPDAWFAAFGVDGDGDLTMVSLTPTPSIDFVTTYNWLDLMNFPSNSPVEVTIFTDSTITETLFTDENGNIGWDVMTYLDPGTLIRVEYGEGENVKELVVENLSVDYFDIEGDQAGGSADEGTQVNFGLEGPDLYLEGFIIAGSAGWMIDFWEDYEIDLQEEMGFWIFTEDEDGDRNFAELMMEEPSMASISAYPQFDQINGNGFPMGETITLVIDNDLDASNGNLYYATAEAGPFSEDEPDVSLVRFYLEGLFDVQPDHYLIMFYEDLFQIHQVEYLNILDVNLEADRVDGLADPDKQVEVWIYWNNMVLTDVDGSGFWTADFSVGPSVWDLQYGDLVTAGVLDEAGNGTWHFYLYSPIAEDDAYLVDEDQVLSEPAPGVLANDYHAVPVPIEAELISGPDYGQLVLNLDGSFSYTPDPDFFGQDSFSYRAKDDRVQSEPAVVTITVDPVNDAPVVSLPSVLTADEGQILLGSGTFYDPDPDTWTGTVDYGDGSAPQALFLTTHQSFDLAHSYPDSGVYTISVEISDGSVVGNASAEVYIYNVAPSVSITSLAGGEDTVLVGLDVALVASFFDPGPDFHTALIDWGDGTDVIDPAFSPLAANHAYSSPGLYTIILTVTDDDGGSGMASASLTVIEPADAAEDVITDLDSILTDPDLPSEAAAAIEDALVDLEGANDGLSNSGALDKIVGGQWNAALVKIERAIQDLEAAEAVDPSLDLSDLKETLIQIAKSVTLEIIATALADGVSAALIDQAYILVSAGQVLLDSGDYLGAVGKFLDALHIL